MDRILCSNSDIELLKNILQEYSLEIYSLLKNHDFNIQKTNKINNSGDNVQKLDEQADIISEITFKKLDLIYGFISEERENMIITNKNGKYIITIDPLDGSQNLNVGFNVGAIFGIYQTNNINNIKNGRDLIAAGYSIFSTSLQFIFGYNNNINFYRYHHINNCWDIFIGNHKIPEKGKIYSINEGISEYFYDDMKRYLEKLKGRSIRWMCCMVTDVHRNLLEGGCFLYPENKKSKNGKLRLIYELYPMAFLWELGGGTACIDLNNNKILDQPFPKDNLHQKNGCILLGPFESNL